MMTDQQHIQNYGSTPIPFQQPLTTTPVSTINDSHQHVYTSLPDYYDEEEEEEKKFTTLLNEHLLATPFIFSVLFFFMLLPYALNVETGAIDVNQLKWKEFILGASGWSFAFLVRKPLSMIFLRLDNVTSSIIMLFFMGLVEEILRTGWLLHIPREYSNKGQNFLAAYYLGIGWESIETIYFIIQNFIEVKWYKWNSYSRYIEERQELKEILGKPFIRVSAYWGIMWRTSWTMVHVGFSCWIVWNLWLAIPASLIHGLLNVIWGHSLSTFGIPATSYSTFMITLCVFLIGLALFNQIV